MSRWGLGNRCVSTTARRKLPKGSPEPTESVAGAQFNDRLLNVLAQALPLPLSRPIEAALRLVALVVGNVASFPDDLVQGVGQVASKLFLVGGGRFR